MWRRVIGNKVKLKMTEEIYAQVGRMSGLGLPLPMIARILNVAPRTLDNYLSKDEILRHHYERGVALATEKVANVAFAQAVSGENTAMTIFWLKCRANWKETSIHEHKVKTLEDLVQETKEREVKELPSE